MSERKILDYNKNEVRERLLKTFHSSTKEWAAADLARATGLPLAQINAEMPAIADEYRGRLRVSDKGDILYSFPNGLKSRYRGFGPFMRKLGRALKRGAIETGKALFKVWILVTLFGYFFLFIALALVAFFGSIAIQQGGGSRDRSDRRGGGGFGGLWLTTSLFDSMIRLWFYSELFKSSEARYRDSFVRRERHPLHKAVFSHVFGDGDPNADWDTVLKKAFVAFVQTHKGIITLPEFMAISGLKPQDAEEQITRFLVEFEGSPEVTESGALYFFFPSLLAKANKVSSAAASTFPLKKLKSFSSNDKKMDRTFRWVNIFNLLFGSYYAWNAMNIGTDVIVRTTQGLSLRGGLSFLYSYTVYLASQIGVANPAAVVGWLLGVAPLAFSVFFFAIPTIRSWHLKVENEMLKRENMRKMLYSGVLSSPQSFDHHLLALPSEEVKPASPKSIEEELQHLAAWSSAEIRADGKWFFKDVDFVQKEVERVRASIKESDFAPDRTIFDSNAPV